MTERPMILLEAKLHCSVPKAIPSGDYLIVHPWQISWNEVYILLKLIFSIPDFL